MHILTKFIRNVLFFIFIVFHILHLNVFYLRAEHIGLLFCLQYRVSMSDPTAVT